MEAAEVYIGDILLPVTPDKITYNHNDRIEERTTLDGNPITLMRLEGAQSMTMEMRIPYSPSGATFRPLYSGQYYMSYFQSIKDRQYKMVLTILRPNGKDTNKEVVLTDWTVTEETPMETVISLTLTDWHTGVASQIDPDTRRIMRQRTYQSSG